MYCTPALLADAKLVRELAQVATPERYPIVADDVMEAALRGEALGGFPSESVEAVGETMVVIERALTDADQVIDGYLRMRKPRPYPVPLSPVPGIVMVWARCIARYLLHKDRMGTEEKSDPIVRDYRDALRFLEQVRDGKFSLGMDDPLPPSSSGLPAFCAPEREFTMDTLKDFGT